MIIDKCLSPIFINGSWQSCGKCQYCKAKRQLNWTIRGKHEALTHNGKDILFITLTYNDDNLPKGAIKAENENDCMGNLKPEDLTNFFKKLRKYLSKKIPEKKIKYLACGEYGGSDRKDGNWRPHYHAIIYGLNKKEINFKIDKKKITHSILDKIWGKGHVGIDKKPFVNTKAIAYTVGYINKKMTDKKAQEHYKENGRIAPFQRQSQGLGKEWLQKNENIYLNLKTGFDGRECSIPRYYIKKIYESEGRKVKIKNEVIKSFLMPCKKEEADCFTDKGEPMKIWQFSTESIQYKIFINPKGTKTAVILSQMHENALRSLEVAKIKYNMSENEYNEIKAKKEKKLEEQMKRYTEEWQNIANMTDEEIAKKYKHITYKNLSRKKNRKYISNKPLSEKTLEQAIIEAMNKNKTIEKRTKKFKRDWEKIRQEKDDFINNF